MSGLSNKSLLSDSYKSNKNSSKSNTNKSLLSDSYISS
jgi:hypothetical protein